MEFKFVTVLLSTLGIVVLFIKAIAFKLVTVLLSTLGIVVLLIVFMEFKFHKYN